MGAVILSFDSSNHSISFHSSQNAAVMEKIFLLKYRKLGSDYNMSGKITNRAVFENSKFENFASVEGCLGFFQTEEGI